MPKITTIQNSFAAGQVSPLVSGRTDTEGYQNGVEEMLNMYPDSRGPAITRDGMDQISRIGMQPGAVLGSVQTALGEYIGFIITSDPTGGLLYIFNSYGLDQNSEYLQNRDFSNGSSFWAVGQTGRGDVVFTNNQAIINPGTNTNYAYIFQLVTVPIITDTYTLHVHTDSIVTYNIRVGTTPTNGSIIPNMAVTDDNFSLSFVPNVASFYIVVEGDAAVNQNTINVDLVSLFDTIGGAAVFPHPWNDTSKIRVINDIKNKRVYMLDGEQPVQTLTYDPINIIYTFAPTVFVSPPVEWTTVRPAVGVINEGKLYLATRNLQFWGSVSDNHLDFTPGINAADSFTLTINDIGVIQWMLTGKNLIIGTSEKEFIITSQGGVIYAGDFSIQEQSSYGSAFVEPVKIGDLILYTSPDRRKIRAMQYVWQQDKFKSTDLTFFSENLTEARIKKMAWQRDPNNILWVHLDDESLISLVYERSNNVWGWSTHNSQGDFTAIATGNDLQRTDLLTLKFYGLFDVYELERTNPDLFMDSILEEFRVTATTIFSGFDEYLGNTSEDVSVFADGNYVGIKTVNASGEITLAEPANLVQAGYAFQQRLVTLPINKGSPTGGSETWWKSFNKLFIKIYNSFIPKINGYLPPTRHNPTPMNASQGPTTEVLEVTQLGYDYETKVTIEQDLPQKLTVIYIAGELDQNKL